MDDGDGFHAYRETRALEELGLELLRELFVKCPNQPMLIRVEKLHEITLELDSNLYTIRLDPMYRNGQGGWCGDPKETPMSFPTPLNPWYVVQRLTTTAEPTVEMSYAVSNYDQDDSTAMFSTNKKDALLFMSLASAARVALSEGAEVRVLTTKDATKEFSR